MMTIETVTEIGRQAIETCMLVSAPILGLSLVVDALAITGDEGRGSLR